MLISILIINILNTIYNFILITLLIKALTKNKRGLKKNANIQKPTRKNFKNEFK